MTTYRTLIALSVAALAAACVSPGSMNAPHMSSGMAQANAMPMAANEPRMVAMKAMHEKMMGAKTPAERQALMSEHMKSMQGGMAMMHEMHARNGMGGMTSMSDGPSMQAQMARREQAMAEHTAMMSMMMDMMAERMPMAP
jgi:hypothetical protein